MFTELLNALCTSPWALNFWTNSNLNLKYGLTSLILQPVIGKPLLTSCNLAVYLEFSVFHSFASLKMYNDVPMNLCALYALIIVRAQGSCMHKTNTYQVPIQIYMLTSARTMMFPIFLIIFCKSMLFMPPPLQGARGVIFFWSKHMYDS